MERFCIIVNSEKDSNHHTAQAIIDYIESRGKTCFLTSHTSSERCDSFTKAEEIPEDTECAIVLGGDGTILHAAKDLLHLDIPILGVNMGTVGYLAEIEPHNIRFALEKVFQNECTLEKRIMLYGSITSSGKMGKRDHALNDIVISRGGQCRVVVMHLYINDLLIDTYVADGLIVSTPTGSTGYNLSAGGPVMKPGINALAVTPICPHSLNQSSFVISSEDRIRLEIGQRRESMQDEVLVYFDGCEAEKLKSGDVIEIKKAQECTKMIKIVENSYFDILKNKLGTERM
ncbi:NAD(+)/NADH kinase [[Clostridium] polysaccharolyticum]|uniref:NAD kinase n=1 Tax=[Clostridium] polysaccharolyticum TaxID=29364 RepID=A0A1I0A1L7_9FIRM|nr:NAD(+)/NADH kinase [[Clostridium] polysaccharolyticum]SES87567.1 NAD+ kinase [[Clostridium] polysaccharolyticum]